MLRDFVVVVLVVVCVCVCAYVWERVSCVNQVDFKHYVTQADHKLMVVALSRPASQLCVIIITAGKILLRLTYCSYYRICS